MLESLRRFDASDVAQQRHKILTFYEQYGEDATTKVFGASRKVVYHWRQLVKDGRGQLAALVSGSTRPDQVRRPEVPRPIVDFIKRLRQEHPRLGKQKIKPLLDRFCRAEGLQPIAPSPPSARSSSERGCFGPSRAGSTTTPTRPGLGARFDASRACGCAAAPGRRRSATSSRTRSST